jgi:glycosyltransferase involved in cell wall biosynthesis
MKQPSLSIVIPCYNEEALIYSTLATLADFLTTQSFDFELLPVNDGSTDRTQKEISKAIKDLAPCIIRPIHNPTNQGKGQAVKDGVLAAVNDIVAFIDADLTVSIEELLPFLEEIKTYDIVVASRALSKTHFEEANPWYRTFLAQGFRFFQTIVLGKSRIKDTQCGFKVFRLSIAHAIFSKVTVQRFAFDAEVLFLAKKFHTPIKQLPVTIRCDHRISRVNTLLDPINMFFALIKIRLNNLRGTYKQH